MEEVTTKKKKKFIEIFKSFWDMVLNGLITVVVEIAGTVAVTVPLYIIICVIVVINLASEGVDVLASYNAVIHEVSVRLNDNYFGIPFIDTSVMYFLSIGSAIGVIFWCLVKKKNRPILKALWTKPKNNNVLFLLIGLAVGFIMNGICILFAHLNGDITLEFVGFNFFPLLLIFICVFIQSSSEEILCRGFLHQRLIKKYNKWAVIIFTSLFFALLHLANPGVTIVSILDIFVSGIIFSICVYFYDSIWMAFGIHTMWNYTQNIIFGLPNSGIEAGYSIFKITSENSSFFYDVSFGIEGTWFAVIIELAFAAILLLIGFSLKIKPYNVWDNFDEREVVAEQK